MTDETTKEVNLGDEESIINQIPIAQFKLNHMSMLKGKLSKLEEHQMEIDTEEEINHKFGESIRLANIAQY